MCGTKKNCECKTWEPKTKADKESLALVAAAMVEADKELEAGADPKGEWEGVLTVEGLRTTDHRKNGSEALVWRQLPIAFFAQFANEGHWGAAIVGNITEIWREPWDEVEGAFLIKGKGTFDLETEEGRRAALMLEHGTLRWNSVDLEVLESEYVEIGGDDKEPDLIDMLFGGDDDVDWYIEFTNARIMGSTMVATPAFQQAVIGFSGDELEIPLPTEATHLEPGTLLASGVVVPETPPVKFFTNPKFDEPTPLTVTADGRILGHLALWDTCHVGFPDTCVTPPSSEQDYALFLTGKVETETGEMVKVGQITFDTGHAKSTASWQETVSHYDHTGTCAADITVGEDDHGIWFSGALRSDLSTADIRAIRATPLSGDWRKVGGSLELVAALSVPVPGFPIVASGMKKNEQVSLIASGPKQTSPLVAMAKEIASLRKAVAPLMPLAKDQLNKRVNGNKVVDIESLRQRVNG